MVMSKRKSNTKDFKKRNKIEYIEGKNGKNIDNVFSLIRSNKDEILGLSEIIFYKTLNVLPEYYYNIVEHEYEEDQLEEIYKDYNNYCSCYVNLPRYLKDEVEEIVLFIREEAIEEKAIVTFCQTSDRKVIYEPKYKFDMNFVNKKVLKFYNQKKKER